jgi:hypothetical protein
MRAITWLKTSTTYTVLQIPAPLGRWKVVWSARQIQKPECDLAAPTIKPNDVKLAAGRQRVAGQVPVKIGHAISFDETMRRAVKAPPPLSGKKAKRKVWRKKRR